MNNQVQFVCLWCCIPPDFVVQITNFFSLVLFSAVIYKRRGKKLISKTIKHKLNNSSKIQFAFLYPKDIQFFLENYRFCRKFGNDANSSGRGGGGGGEGEGFMFFVSLRRNAYKNRYVIHHKEVYIFNVRNFRSTVLKYCLYRGRS